MALRWGNRPTGSGLEPYLPHHAYFETKVASIRSRGTLSTSAIFFKAAAVPFLRPLRCSPLGDTPRAINAARLEFSTSQSMWGLILGLARCARHGADDAGGPWIDLTNLLFQAGHYKAREGTEVKIQCSRYSDILERSRITPGACGKRPGKWLNRIRGRWCRLPTAECGWRRLPVAV